MNLPRELLRKLDNPGLSLSDRARLLCQIAFHLEKVGEYEEAREQLAEFWRGVGAWPNTEGLDDSAKAAVLLRSGALTGWIGSANQIEGAQEAAKDLISQSLRLFLSRGLRSKAGEAQSDLALCYWRAGAYDEARVMLEEAFRDIDERNIEQRAITLLRQALVERESKRLNEALRFHNQAKPLFEKIDNHLLSASFHLSFANTLNRLSSTEERKDYVDLALIEYTAASFHYEQAGHERFQACVENNIGYLLGTIGRFANAHEHLDRAQVLMTRLKDNVHLAQVDETRAGVLLAEGRNVEAAKTARAAVLRLEKGDELSLLAEALTTHGIALARLSHPEVAREAFQRAISTSEQAGDTQRAGIAALTLIEQLGTTLSTTQICEALEHAGPLLDKTQDRDILRRLAKTAFEGLFLVQAVPTPPDWNNFSFREAVKKFEANLITKALKEAGGSVTQAAQLLGFKHHQSMSSLLAHRHSDLIGKRKPIRKRRKHLLKHPKRNQKKT